MRSYRADKALGWAIVITIALTAASFGWLLFLCWRVWFK